MSIFVKMFFCSTIFLSITYFVKKKSCKARNWITIVLEMFSLCVNFSTCALKTPFIFNAKKHLTRYLSLLQGQLSFKRQDDGINLRQTHVILTATTFPAAKSV